MYTVEYYSASERMEVLTPAIAQMNLEEIKLSKISQSKRTNTV